MAALLGHPPQIAVRDPFRWATAAMRPRRRVEERSGEQLRAAMEPGSEVELAESGQVTRTQLEVTVAERVAVGIAWPSISLDSERPEQPRFCKLRQRRAGDLCQQAAENVSGAVVVDEARSRRGAQRRRKRAGEP